MQPIAVRSVERRRPANLIAAGQTNNELLAGMPDADFARIRDHLQRVRLVAGQVLYEAGERADRIYFPDSGLIALVTPLDGQEVANTSRGRDGGIGYFEATGSGAMVSRVVVQIGGSAWRLPAAAWRAAMDASGSLRDWAHRRAEFLLAEARQSIACHASHPAAARLARHLLEMSDHTGLDRFPLTQDFMADMIGVGRTTITHSAGALKRQTLIRYTRGSVAIVDREGLGRESCECYRRIRLLRTAILGPGTGEPRIS